MRYRQYLKHYRILLYPCYNIDIFTVGSDWVGTFDYLKDYCKVVYLDRTKNISSTMLRIKETPIQRIGVIGTGRIANRFIPEAALFGYP